MNDLSKITRLLPLAALIPALLQAEPDATVEPEAPTRLNPMVVVANKAPRPLNDVAGTVTLIDSQQIDDQLVHSIEDLVRYEPGIAVEGGGNRFGSQGYNIRGIGGNRVAIEVDGIPVSDQFDVGNFSNSGRDPVDVAILERVEILRGPASTLYGSNAIGGVVAYITKDPSDLVGELGQPSFALRGEYQGVDQSVGTTATAALVEGNWGALASLTYRDGQQLDRGAGSELDRNQFDSLSAFVKLTHDTPRANRLNLTLDHFQRDDVSDIQSILGSGRFRSTTGLTGDDRTERDRLSLGYQFISNRNWVDQGQVLAYLQDSQVDQFTSEERAGSGFKRDRDFSYRQQVNGLEINLGKDLAWGSSQHRLGYGLELTDTRTREQRDGLQIDLETGASTDVILGEHFPVRDFPITDTLEAGLYLQDEISWADSRWTVIPAIRFDYYDLSPQPDGLYREDFPDTAVVGVSEHDVSPKLGFVYQASDSVSLFGQYAHGFRAPPFEDVNIGLDIPMFNIRAIANPELKSENSDGLELGMRYLNGGTSLSIAAYYTDYQDFIETKVNLGPDPASGVLLFQSQNIDEAHIYGAELRLQQDLGYWTESLEDFDLQLGLSWTEGTNDDDDQPINSVQPAEAILGVNWRAPTLPLTASLTATLVDAKDEVAAGPTELFQPAGYGIVDLTASYRPSDSLAIRVGLFNLADKTYWRWSEVRGLAPTDPLVSALSAPGRNAAISFSMRW